MRSIGLMFCLVIVALVFGACGAETQKGETAPPAAATPTSPEKVPPRTPEPKPTEGTETPSVTPKATRSEPSCFDDVAAIETAMDDYYRANWSWPTATGRGGDIVWEHLIPEYLDAVPVSDDTCDWQVNTAPEGTVCLWNKADKGVDCSCGSVCTGQPGETPPSTVAATEPPPTSAAEPPECEEDRQAIKAALDAFVEINGQWPTADGKPGLIVWNKIVPDLLESIPSTVKCKWQVNSDPLGEVCRSVHC